MDRRRIQWPPARLADASIMVWLWVAVVVFGVGTVAVLDHYGGLSYFPGLVGGFGASLAAFALALSWDHERELNRARDAVKAQEDERARDLRERHDQLATEARRRLEPVRKELLRNKKSVDDLVFEFASGNVAPNRVVNPELLEGAWSANAPRLSEILSDYDLVGDLASTYGRIEELRWRLRQRTALVGVNLDVAMTLGGMTKGLIEELALEIADVLARVVEAIADPPVRVHGNVVQIDVTFAGRGSLTAGPGDVPMPTPR